MSPYIIHIFSWWHHGAEPRTGGGPSRGRGRWRHRLDPSDARRMDDFDGLQYIIYTIYIYIYLVGGFKHDFFIFHFIYGMSSFPLTHFFRGVKIVLVNYKDIQV